MATTKTARLTSREAGLLPDARLANGTLHIITESEALGTAELDTADIVLYDLYVPSNGLHQAVWIYNDDLDSSTGLVIDIGLFAAEKMETVTSSTVTKHAKQAVLDADALVDGSTVGQAATTVWTQQAPDSVTFGPDDAGKAYWDILGYDEDPKALLQIGVTMQAGATGAQAGDLAIRIEYIVD